eukprot:8795494-Pyramimonas_sp.AAC.1
MRMRMRMMTMSPLPLGPDAAAPPRGELKAPATACIWALGIPGGSADGRRRPLPRISEPGVPASRNG